MLRLQLIRWLERKLSVQNLYRVLLPFAYARALVNTAFKNYRPCTPLPECLEAAWSPRLNQRLRMSGYLNDIVDFFPDRLAEPKWRERCRINGLEHLHLARQNGRPIVLAFVHFGPFELIRAWLRSVGIPVAALFAGRFENRSPVRRYLDKYFPDSAIPTVFSPDRLREMLAFLAAGHPLCIAVDNGNSGDKKIETPFCPGWNFRMNTGAVRLAIRQQAVLVPVTIIDEGGWRFRLELGRPVPAEFLANEAGWLRAGKFLLEEMMPHWLAHPEQCKSDFVLCLKKRAADFCRPNDGGKLN
jgi:Bacterial lipid A biosynthesis acyltransferase